jgi:ABC-type branched-subunit amino acid transport system ATPase component
MVNPMRFTEVRPSRRLIWEEERPVSETILKSEAIHTFIGQHHILQGVSFEAKADAVTVLIGRNGAGKSSTLKTIMGLMPAAEGKIIFKGQEIQSKKPYLTLRWKRTCR